MNFPLPSCTVIDLSLPNQFTTIRWLGVGPVDSSQHQVFIKFDGSDSSLNQNHSWKVTELIRRFDDETIESQLLGIHGDFEFMGDLGQSL